MHSFLPGFRVSVRFLLFFSFSSIKINSLPNTQWNARFPIVTRLRSPPHMRVIWWGFNQATQFGKFTIGVCVVLALRAAFCEGIPKENRIHTFRPHPNQVWLNIEYLHSSTSQGVLGPIGVSSPAEYSCHTPSPVQCHTVSTVSKVFTQYSCHTLSPIQCHNTPPLSHRLGAKPLFVKGCRSDQGGDNR